ncbi:MAG: alpha/beta hydrolase [Catenulispora sp.]|nr:alpha/beta hydrolase [Catenulispora sp.]
MRRHVLNALSALAAVTALAVSGCSSSASQPAGAAAPTSTPSASTGTTPSTPSTPSASPSIDAVCLHGVPGAEKNVTHFAGGNDHVVEAYTIGTGPVGVVLAHQVESTLCEWSDIWTDFPAKDYTVMAITMGGGIDTDVAKAVEQLRARGLKKIVLVGASMGGSAVLAAAGKITPQVQGVVSLSAPASYGVADAISAVKTFHVPVSYFAGGGDARFAADAQRMYDATTEQDKALKILADSQSHGVELWPQVRDDVFAFITKHTQ